MSVMFLFGRQFGPANPTTSGTISVSPGLHDLRQPNKPSRSAAMRERGQTGGESTPVDKDDDLAANLKILGLAPGASWSEITEAHRRLASDMTPGPSASHKNVARAQELLRELNAAYAWLQELATA